jgi:hypothetical protein
MKDPTANIDSAKNVPASFLINIASPPVCAGSIPVFVFPPGELLHHTIADSSRHSSRIELSSDFATNFGPNAR